MPFCLVVLSELSSFLASSLAPHHPGLLSTDFCACLFFPPTSKGKRNPRRSHGDEANPLPIPYDNAQPQIKHTTAPWALDTASRLAAVGSLTCRVTGSEHRFPCSCKLHLHKGKQVCFSLVEKRLLPTSKHELPLAFASPERRSSESSRAKDKCSN